uniref:Rab-GAP TBC domain-containing protein n=1 Tax=Branchiostoma floridae TaxID=7739 RepID=C3ZWT4_BRAFL|eukprot:XP_002586992.1 hypothetical protein BRAFLDRAFT_129954 [Branchiostoma floridae]
MRDKAGVAILLAVVASVVHAQTGGCVLTYPPRCVPCCRRLCPDISFFQQATDHPCERLVNADSGIETLRKRVEHTILKAVNIGRTGWALPSQTRLCPDISFFQQATDHPCERLVNADSGIETLRKRVEHTILKAANVGKNRLGITVTNVKNCNAQEHAEADTFFCFTNLMSEIRDNFIKMLDDSASGIGSSMQNVLTLLKKHDQQLWRCLEDRGVRPQFYLFRWLTLLLSQEFKMPDVIRVWDSLFADRRRFDFLYCVCCAMIICIRSRILEGDFSDTMRTLQNYPDGDIHVVLRKAVEICPS